MHLTIQYFGYRFSIARLSSVSEDQDPKLRRAKGPFLTDAERINPFMSERTRHARLPEDPVQALEKIVDALRDLQFGSVEITVHEGRIVLIERKERLRLNIPFGNPDLSKLAL
jgi:hypothetical protein